MISTVRQILQNKSPEVWSVSPETTVLDALKLMAEKDIGAVLVMDGEKLVGVFSERDYARKVPLLGHSAEATQVKELMTPDVYCVGPHQTVQECMALMTAKRIRHLPVVENNKVIGIVTIGDVVKAVISDQALLLEEMEHYISGTGYGR